MLRRYGVNGLSVNQTFSDDGQPQGVSVQFIVPDSQEKDAKKVPVSLPVDVRRVYDALYGRPIRWIYPPNERAQQVYHPTGYNTKKLAQAERVAWRNVVLWVDAALSAASVGFQTITEAFFAHTVVQLDNGQRARMVEVVEAMQGQLPNGVRALLAAPAEDVES
jgi:hypothetical protein